MNLIISDCYLVKRDEVLLCTKKKANFGQGFLMGPGGKIERGETSEGCAVRETKEEIGVIPKTLKKAVTIRFDYFNGKVPVTQEVDFYLVDDWEGQPSETEEMIPEWFKKDEVSYAKTLPANEKFLKPMLDGKIVRGTMLFDEDFNPLNSNLTILSS